MMSNAKLKEQIEAAKIALVHSVESGTSIDMPQASDLPPIEKAFDLAGVRRAGRAVGILPLCAKSGDGVTDALRWALDTVTEKRS